MTSKTKTPDKMSGGSSGLLTRTQRKEAGKALRAVVSRESHAAFSVDPARDPLPILAEGDKARVPSLIPLRYQRMAVSPFTFYRGAAAVMAQDFAAMARIGLPVQACGDCHLMNFGVFSSPENHVLFDINDFDETCPGVDFIVDLKRLAASVALAAQDVKMPDKRARALAAASVKAYRDFMNVLAGEAPLAVWNTRMDLQDQIEGLGDANLETKILASLAKDEKKGKDAPDQPGITTDAEGRAVFVDKPPTVFHVEPDGTPVAAIFSDQAVADYKRTLLPERAALLDRYALSDVAFKAVGVGSVGTFCAVGLMTTADGEQIVLQLKQAMVSAVAGLAATPPGEAHQGKRVVDGQRAMQAAPDPFLGWTQDTSGRYFYIRQLKNRRLASLGALMEGKALPAYATLCGRTLARAHARTGDPAMIAGYLGASDVVDEAVASFAMAYASQTVLDHAKLAASPLASAAAPKAAA